ncbi:glutamate synthase large subunit [Melioribacteraceae bacterium 09-Me]|uniref:Glutamate synthase [NADPH] large chain n=2 Tax=Stygiobacter electus TaxID=3032292 RepID=A0AAE3NXA4_9BACT|nr:glutamate synthase large subunit [Stygiobacter electus]MDF1611766.1 glutamate synthase large subunit [Stygiobacter electus]
MQNFNKKVFEDFMNSSADLNNKSMYSKSFEHDACGMGFVADIKGRKSRAIIDKALEVLKNLEHRGAVGADPETGDGAGILIQMPDEFIRKICEKERIKLPDYGRYAVGMMFLPQKKSDRKHVENIIEKIVLDENQKFLGWRDVPVNTNAPGKGARATLPYIRQCFISANKNIVSQDEFERKLYLIRRIIDHRVRHELKLDRSQYYVASFSSRVLIYKGMLKAQQLIDFYKDITDKDMKSAMTMLHMRFSTNTFPTWDLAHPFRMIAHNGEINTLRGNKNWMSARQHVMESPYYGKDLKRMLPISMEEQSDSATFDNVLELLVMSGRSLPHAMMMMIPEAWSKNDLMDPDRKAFYEYHATMMEPWDGPAAVVFTDGNIIGATLDRNGLRPARYVITKDDLVVLTSEAGTWSVDAENVAAKGKLQPGKMFILDLQKGRIVDDEEVKKEIVTRKPYRKWINENMIKMHHLPSPDSIYNADFNTLHIRQRIFGYTKEDIEKVILPMAQNGEEAVGSMGTDASLAILSDKPQLLFRYFKQLFAQVTNPPIDPIREELVMELTTYVGPEQNLLDETPKHANRLELEHPILSNSQIEKIRHIAKGMFKSQTIPLLFNPFVHRGMRNRLDEICNEAVEAVKNGITLLILSDKGVDKEQAAIPSLLATSAIHHTLINAGLRTKTGIIVETGEAREIHHFALLLGYGANAINPYLTYETLAYLVENKFLPPGIDYSTVKKNFVKAVGKGLFKIFSKMGISTLQSYCGAQIFEAIGLDSEIIENYFKGTPTKIEGLSLEMLEEEIKRRHLHALDPQVDQSTLDVGGIYHYRKDGEHHLWNPITISKLQISTRNNDFKTYKEYADYINNQEKHRVTLRSLFELDFSNPIPIDEVEPAKEIVKRFATGAMSFGSISREAHTNLAIAMNRIGGKSNTGEGGEESERFIQLENGDSLRSAIKQVASARFGVTANYLVNADELQIKMAQGAKPGEGGQLPGHKVDAIIAKVRHSTPGVTLISPPPHHDIYSIEDLKQLIFDLKNINPKARISVKLVSESGVGTIAAGVAKAHADHILISGHDGGTGASPISSIQYAGSPWELGLSEAHQTLVINGLRDRVYLATDGQIKTGRDVVIAALLGAEEFGFATAPLVTQGCILMRKCHLNTCPVGVATQDPELRKKFTGKPEYLINFFFFVAEEVREYMAKLGFRTFNEMIGQTEKIIPQKLYDHWKIRGIDFSKVLYKPNSLYETKFYKAREQNHELENLLDHELIEECKNAIEKKEQVVIHKRIKNTNRTVGTMLSGEVTKKYGEAGLPHGTIKIYLRGTAGQSFGAFLAKGIELHLTGESNDYFGKGLSGGKLSVKIPPEVTFDPSKNIIVGNTCLYGATSGEAFINGVAGERFAVRNSGANAVVEGVGDHACEYMTGGRVVVLGKIGRNFAAGMSGGIAYIWDPSRESDKKINHSLVDVEYLIYEEDMYELFGLIKKHYDFTNSQRAKFIIDNWNEEKDNFWKVIPKEFKKALAKIAAQEKVELKEGEIING